MHFLKMHKFISSLLILLLVSVCTPVHLPSSFKKCDRKQSDFGQCLVKAVENAVGQLNHSFKEVGLRSVDPLDVPSMTIAPGSGPTNFQQNFKNLKITGISKGKFSKFDMNFDKKIIAFECTVPQVVMAFAYDINGKVLVLPFYGKGPGTITLDDLKFSFTFNLDEYENKGAKHYKVIGTKLSMDPKRIQFKLDNLFNGDEKLGNNINQVFNENWKALFDDVKTSYEDAFGQVFTAVLGNFLEKVPISEIFQ